MTGPTTGTRSKTNEIDTLQGLIGPHATDELTDLRQAASFARARLGQTSDVRLDRVANLRHQIASGTYYVPAALLADRIIAHMMG